MDISTEKQLNLRHSDYKMGVLGIDIDAARLAQLVPILDATGMVLHSRTDVEQDSLYRQVALLQPEIILVNSNSSQRDSVEHLAQLQNQAARAVIHLADQHSEGINRLACEAGVSVYAVDSVPTSLLQVLVDLLLYNLHSFNALCSEVARLQSGIAARQALHQAKLFLAKRYGLQDSQAAALLHNHAQRQRRDISDVAHQLLATGALP